ncbi:hypothetical protein DFJ73DRAFT_768376 [Zopfochytrium polystomum]|nr:hypothetical protein DFJ73DRAFT_768376 [Zopfochytrium polystomum]
MNVTFAELARQFSLAASGVTLNFYSYSASACTDSSLGLLAHFVGQSACQTIPCTRQPYGPYVRADCIDGNFDSMAAQSFAAASYVALAGYDASCAYGGTFYVRADGGCYTTGSRAADSGFVATIAGSVASVSLYQNPTCAGSPRATVDSTMPLDCRSTGLVITGASKNGSPLPTASGSGSPAPTATPTGKSGAAPVTKSTNAFALMLAAVAAGLVASAGA